MGKYHIKPISDVDWQALTLKQQWDIRVALRGPDHNSTLLKQFTTAIIRHACSKVTRVGGTIVSRCPAVILAEHTYQLPVRKDQPWGFNAFHFMQHVSEATELLGLPHVSIPNDTWHIVFSNLMPYEMGLRTIASSLRSSEHSEGLREYTKELREQVALYIVDFLDEEDEEESDE